MIERSQLAGLHRHVVLLHDVVEAEAILPCTAELVAFARELLTYWPDVHVPGARLHRFDQDVILVERCAVEHYLATCWVKRVVHALIHSVLDGLHCGLGLGIVVAHQVIKNTQGGSLTKDLSTTQTCLGTEHLHTQLLPNFVGELQVVVSERGLWNPLLQELTVVVAELNVLSCGLHTVVHRVRHVDHPVDLTEARDLPEHCHVQRHVFHEQCGLSCTTEA